LGGLQDGDKSISKGEICQERYRPTGVSVTPTSPPVKAWVDLMTKAAGDLFDKCYDNMKAAYK